MLTANFKAKNRPDISVSWSNVDDLHLVVDRQTTNFGKSHVLSNEELKHEIESEYQIIFDFITHNTNLPNNPVILDIGSGSSIVDMILYQYYDCKASMYLLDGSTLKDDEGGHPSLHHQDFKPFNRWEPVVDAIRTNKYNNANFKVLTTTQEWPEHMKCDLIFSNCSWGLHYPIETYWEKVKAALKPGGYLVIRPFVNLNNPLELINSEFGNPLVIDNIEMHFIKSQRPNDFERWAKIFPNIDDMEIWGHRAIWQKPL